MTGPAHISRGRLSPGNIDWSQAACLGADLDLFFPPESTSGQKGRHWYNQAGVQEALAYCKDCPIQEACREYAIANNIEHGIWGGTSNGVRKQIRRERKRSGSPDSRWWMG